MGSLSEFLRKKHEEKYTYDSNGMKVKKKKEPKTVKDIKISKKYLPLRISLFVIFLAGGITAICFGVANMSNVDKGWREISSSGGKSSASNFTFLYYFSSDNGQTNGTVYKSLTSIYTEMSQKTYFVFSSIEETSGTNNIYYLNRHINQEVEVDPLLYKTLKKCDEKNNKVIYFAPIYAQYYNLFNSSNDLTAKTFDPYYSTEAETYYQTIADFVNNGDVYFSFPSENKVILNVSPTYQNYLEENNIVDIVNMSYIENAASIDYFVDTLEEGNFRNYRISSYEGYVRSSIDETLLSVQNISYNCYTLTHGYIVPDTIVKISKPFTLVEFKKFPVSSNEDYYIYADGSLVHHFLDENSGKYISATESLYLYGDAKTKTVLDTLLDGSKIYIKDSFDKTALKNSTYNYIYVDGNKIKHNDNSLTFTYFLDVNFCDVCHQPFQGTSCPYDGSEEFENVKFESELEND